MVNTSTDQIRNKAGALMLIAAICGLGCGMALAQSGGNAPVANGASPKVASKPGTPFPNVSPNAKQDSAAPESGKKPEVPLSDKAKAIMEHTTWAFPMFKAADAQEKTITQIDHYPYTEQLYSPSFTIQAHPESQDSFNSPEEAMISRISDMMNADYKSWFEVWDPPSQQLTVKLDEEHKITPEAQLALWKGTFSQARLTLAHRVQTGSYVIVTYYLTSNGQAIYPAEFPVIFHEIDKRWYATQDLTKDPLPALSPWTKGDVKKEIDIRPVQEEKATKEEKVAAR